MLERTKESWPIDYAAEARRRFKLINKLRKDPRLFIAAWNHYRTHPIDFINDWGIIHEPRDVFVAEATPLIPFRLFKRQREMVEFIICALEDQQRALIEKSRDMGATWICCWLSIWLWLFYPGSSIGWGSQDADDVDKIGNPSSIFQKMRIGIRNIPHDFWPEGFSDVKHMLEKRIINPANGSVIIGGVGDRIGRGERTLIYFKDESSWYEHADDIEASLSSTCRVQVDMSSVHGTNTLFHRSRETGIDWSPGERIPKGRTGVFVFDWRDHPGRSPEWYELLRAEHERKGTLHILAQEIDRNYAASVEGVIIPAIWVEASIDAHLLLEFEDSGRYGAALDLAGEGGDTNALTTRRGVILKTAEEWGANDSRGTMGRVLATCGSICPIELQYDYGGGWGESFKTEFNRLMKEELLPHGFLAVSWDGGGAVVDKDKPIIAGDRNSPLNGDYYHNFKAQATWALRRRLERTYHAVQAFKNNDTSYTFDEDDLISIPSTLPLIYKIKKELSQPVMTQSSRLRLMVDKKPDGTPSPNLFDSIVMNFFPVKSKKPLYFSPEVMMKARMSGMRRF